MYAVISAYNEEDKIGTTVSASKKFTDKIIVVDDCSKDLTFERAKCAGADILIKHEYNQGQGAAIRHGLERAYLEGADIAVTLDGDFQHDPSEIPLLVSEIIEKKFDVALGSRLVKRKNIPLLRLVFNHLLSFFCGIFFNFKVVDSQTGFRAFNRKAMKSMKLTIDRYDWTFEMADQIVQNGLKYTETPINVRYFHKPHQSNFIDGIYMLWGMIRYYAKKH